jgi:uncharacterized protein
MRHKFWLRATLALALASSAPTWAQQRAPIDPERLAVAQELLEVTGTAKSFAILLNGMREPLRQMALRANPGKETEVSRVLDLVFERMRERTKEVLDLIVPLYAERFSVAELKEVTAFYQSPTGAKFIAAQPEILQQSMALGQAWGRRIGEEAQGELNRELQSRGLKNI